MSDPWGQLNPEERGQPRSETPPAEPLQAPGPRIASEPAAAVLLEFSRWLERWAVYAQAWATQAEGTATAEQEENQAGRAVPPAPEGPPANWQAAATQGPPAHWLALFENPPEEASVEAEPGAGPELPDSVSSAGLIRRFQAELADFLGDSLPVPTQPQGEPHGAPSGEGLPGGQIQAGEPAVSEAPVSPVPPGPPGVAQPERASEIQARPPGGPASKPREGASPAAASGVGNAPASVQAPPLEQAAGIAERPAERRASEAAPPAGSTSEPFEQVRPVPETDQPWQFPEFPCPGGTGPRPRAGSILARSAWSPIRGRWLCRPSRLLRLWPGKPHPGSPF